MTHESTPEPQPTTQASPKSNATTATSPAHPPASSGPRTSPIVWGALILGFCGYVIQRTLAPGNIDATTWITVVTIGLGILLLGVGVAVLIRNRRRSHQRPKSALPGE